MNIQSQFNNQNPISNLQSHMLNLSFDAIFAWELNGNIIYWNKGAEKLYEYISEEAIMFHSYKLLKTVFPHTIDNIKSTLVRDGFWNGEIEQTTKSGSKLITDSRLQLIIDELGRKIVIETNRDITKYKKTENELIYSNHKLTVALESVGAGIWHFDMTTNRRIWSPKMFELYGVDDSKSMTVDLGELPILSEDKIRLERMLEQAYENHEEFLSSEFQISKSYKDTVWIKSTGKIIYDEMNRPKDVIGINLDITEQKKIEESLKSQKELFEATIENMYDAVVIYDKEGKIVAINAVARELYSNIELDTRVKNIHKGFQYYDLDNNIISLDNLPTRRVIKGEKIKNERIKVKYPDKTRFIEINAVPILNDENELAFAVISHHDISDIVEYEERLKQQAKFLQEVKKKLEEAQEFAHLGYWESNEIDGKSIWSEELIHICGLNRNNFVPTFEAFKKMVHPDDRDLIANVIKGLIRGIEIKLDLRLIRPDNEVIWIHEKIRNDYDSSGNLIRRYGIVQDITQRKLNEIKLKESEDKFKELAENLGEIIWVRQNAQFVYINPAYEKVWGKTCQSLYDNPRSFIDSIHPEDKEKTMQAYLAENDTSNGLFDYRYKIIRPDGTIRWIWSRRYPIYDKTGRMIRVVGISEDITNIKEYEASLRNARSEAENANKAKSQFLANMSHEIRTPMNGVLGMAQLLVMDLQGEQKEMAKMIKTSGDNLLTIINDILDLSKIESGEVTLSQEKFNLNSLVIEVDNLIQPLVVRKGLKYKSHIDKEIKSQVIGDPGRLKQILINLLGNAIKFTERGSVELSIVKGKVLQDRVQLVFSVKDTGIGISTDKIGQLFTYFTQGDDSVTKKYGGTGLGLAIAKQLINMMDGEISVDSELGVGSNFSFTGIFLLTTAGKESTITNQEKD